MIVYMVNVLLIMNVVVTLVTRDQTVAQIVSVTTKVSVQKVLENVIHVKTTPMVATVSFVYMVTMGYHQKVMLKKRSIGALGDR